MESSKPLPLLSDSARAELAPLLELLGKGRTVDPSLLEELEALASDLNPDPVAEVVALFLSDSPARMDGLLQASMLADVSGMHAHAHALKGSAANLGAERLLTLLTFLDRDLKQGKSTTAPLLIPMVQQEYQTVARWFESLLLARKAAAS